MISDCAMISEGLEFLTRKESYRFFHCLTWPDANDIEGIKQDLTKGANGDIALYIHIPFCQKLCPYCSFVRYEYEEKSALLYMRNLRRELDLYLNLIPHKRIVSVYIGGGTPTLLIHPLLDLIHYLQDRLDVKEISVETTPHDLTPQKIKDLSSHSVTRLSIGVQSFSDKILYKLGRLTQSSDCAKKAIALAQGNFETVNVDMIWDLPQQDLTHLTRDINTLFELDVDQVTFYPLVPSPNRKTLMEQKFNRTNQGLLRKNRRHKQTYEFIQKAMKKRYVSSTIWCFSKRGVKVIDEYAIDYEEYIGLGCGSISLINGHYNVNTFPINKYNQLLAQGNLPIVRNKKLSGWELSNYRLLTGLFGVRINKRQIASQRGKGLRWKLSFLKKLGYLIESKNFFSLTPIGMYQVDLLIRQIFAGMNSLREFCLEKGI